MADVWEELKSGLKDGDTSAIEELYRRKHVKTFLTHLKDASNCQVLRDNLSSVVEICRVVADRNEDILASYDFFSAVEDIIDQLEKAFQTLLTEYEDELPKHKDIWTTTFTLYKLSLESASPLLCSSWSWVLRDDEKVQWKELSVTEHVEFYKLLLKMLPLVVVKKSKKAKRNVLGDIWNGILYDVFYKILDTYNPKSLDSEIQPALVDITNYAVDKILELKPEMDDMTTTYHQIYIYVTTRICFENVELSALLMPAFEKIKGAGFPSDDSLVFITNNCVRMVIEKKGVTDSSSLQPQIDVFLKECKEDSTSPTPELLLKAYSQQADLIHQNLAALMAKAADMPIQHSMKLCQLTKLVAVQKPDVVDEAILGYIYPLLSDQSLTYFSLGILSTISHVAPTRVDVSKIQEFGANNAIYLHTVCEILTAIGADKSTSQTKAGEVIEWLLVQCLNPSNFSHRKAMLAAAKAIGQQFKNRLLQFKPLIVTLDADPALKEVTSGILDYLEDRSLLNVDKKVEEQAAVIQNVSTEVDAIDDRVDDVEQTVSVQADQIKSVTESVEVVKQDVKVVKAELAEAIIDIERIDRKTVSTTPKWCSGVAKLMNPEAPADWKLMAKRLSFTNDDLKAWVAHEDPCTSMLTEWFATHKSSEATRAVYIVLKEIGREDAAGIVANAMEMAGEMVPVDEPLDLKNPPAVFISYQWGVQDKAKCLKDYLTDAGYSCWLDIGQMGGGDKLYEKIDNGIRAAKVVVSLVTEKYAESLNCNKEVGLSVTLHKPMFPLLMEKMAWPPSGSMGPIFSEYLFVRFYQRENEQSKAPNYWPEAKMDELLMQLRHYIEPDVKLVTKKMDNWWLSKTGKRILGPNKPVNSPTVSPEIFISYQWDKQKEVSELYKRLTSLGFSCWLDIEQMGAGDSLFDKIDNGIRSCKVVLSCITEKYSLSLNCRREVSLAGNLNKTIIPLLLESICWPPPGPMSMHLTQLQNLDFTQQKSLIEGESFHVLLVILGQHGVVRQTKLGKGLSSLTTSVAAYEKFKKPTKAAKPANTVKPANAAKPASTEKAESSKSCNIL